MFHSALRSSLSVCVRMRRALPSIVPVEGRHPDRRDEAAQAALVSSVEHHPSSWELSA